MYAGSAALVDKTRTEGIPESARGELGNIGRDELDTVRVEGLLTRSTCFPLNRWTDGDQGQET
jgi:hypothetical protein